jgi:hypothetical protein
MKILAFRLHPLGPTSVRDTAAAVAAMPLQNRFFLGRNDLRLENWFEGQQFICMAFGRARHGHGPGQMGQDVPLSDINLGDGRTFGEDTALVVDKATGFAAIQYNHYGPRARSIEQYLTAADLTFNPGAPQYGFSMGAVLRPDVYDQIRDMAVLKELEFTISLPSLNAAGRPPGRSLLSVVTNPYPEGTETVTMKLKANRARDASIRPDDFFDLVNDLLPHIGGGLKDAKVVGRRGEGEERETIDLVEEQVARSVQLVPGPGQRLAVNDRWQALEDTLRQWLLNRDVA